MCLKESCFPDCWKVSSMVSVFENVRERSTAKNYHLVNLLSVVSKIFEKLATCIFQQVQGQANWSQFHSLKSSEILCVRYSAYFPLFSVIDTFKQFWTGHLYKNIQIMMDFLQPPSLTLHFSYFILMTFLMLSVILLSMLMTPLSTHSVIRMVHLIWGNNQNQLLNLNLINKTLQWSKKKLADFNAGKTYLVSLVRPNSSGAVNVKMDGSVLHEKPFFKMLDWIGAFTQSLLLQLSL